MCENKLKKGLKFGGFKKMPYICTKQLKHISL